MNAAVVPVRSISGAKNRLASCLEQGQRRELALTMLEDMLVALRAARRVDLISVVSADEALLEQALVLGADVVDERSCASATGAPRGLNAAVSQAARVLERRGASRLLAIPGDVPLLRPSEIDELLAIDAALHPVVLVPSSSPGGTNGLLLSPPTVITPRFEGASLEAHRRACESAGISCLTVELPGFALDVDTPDDLDRLSRANGCRTASLVASWREREEDRLRSKPAA
ncbi:MAG: 2-phospho-L-lactate guanylyltransferase [Candidatus Binatia bacterium]